jgi:periplasmic protein TonB
MANSPTIPPVDEAGHDTSRSPQAEAPSLVKETDGSMWTSLFSNLGDAFSRDTSAPLKLDSRPIESDVLLQEEGVFASLWSSLRDVFFPRRLPPLVLESRPIPVIDRMAVKRNPLSTGIAIGFYAILLGLLWYFQRSLIKIIQPKEVKTIAIDVPPPLAPPKAVKMGGGGGQKGPAPVSKGSPPKFDPVQIVPPKAQVIHPLMPVAPTIDVQKDLKMDTNMPNIGMPNAPTVGVSMGNGNGSGLGSGNGNGMGPGEGGNYGGGVRQIGGGVSPPSWLHKVEPEFSEEARKAKIGGNVLVYMIVDAHGHPTHIKVIRGLGMGLDEKAIEAMQQSTFHPALENGKAVPVELQVEVNFQIF